MGTESHDIKRIQGRLLLMAKTIAGVLEEYNIPYMLSYGTLLGAVRHKGFIPWDDDFDFYLFDDTYDTAIRVLCDKLPDWLFVEYAGSEPLYFHAWAHVKDLKSEVSYVAYSQDNFYAHKGLIVDLYKATAVKRCELQAWLDEENEKYIERRRSKGLISSEDYEKRKADLNQNRLTADKGQNTGQDIVYGMINAYSHKYMEPSDIFPLIKAPFEDTFFFIPANADEILSDIYGDYMTLPPEGERKGHLGEVFFYE